MFWMLLNVWWKKTAKPWLKKNWVYIVFFPLGVLLLIAALRKKAAEVRVVSPELSEADEVKREAQEDKDAGLVAAALERDQELKAAEAARNTLVSELIKEQEHRSDDPPKDDELTGFLRQIGKDVRQ